jgi:hypothetical protein
MKKNTLLALVAGAALAIPAIGGACPGQSHYTGGYSYGAPACGAPRPVCQPVCRPACPPPRPVCAPVCNPCCDPCGRSGLLGLGILGIL